ncbi:MAG TPA: Uma2 family endonuclease [Blastocatellia bacterium]
MASLSTSPLVKTYSLEEFWELPDPPDRSKLELIAGVLYMTPPPEYTHDNTVSRLNRLLTRHLDATGDKGWLHLPRAAIWTGPNTHLEPDLFYNSAELERKQKHLSHRNTADLVIEVVSPGSAIYDRNTKAEAYFALGVRELWLVNEVAQTVEVRVRAGDEIVRSIFSGDDSLTSTVLPKLALPVLSILND